MRKRTSRRHAAGMALTLLTFSLGATLAVVVAGSASASSPLPTNTTPTTTTTSTTTSTSSETTPLGSVAMDPKAGRFSVINGTVNAASDHEIVASSAFPNYTNGAVDNYYSMAHSQLDNSPFAEGTASPADTGPIGQTAAAGNFQQSQYVDARWPGGPATGTFGSQGAPYADASAGNYLALANASEPSRPLTGPKLSMPKGFDSKLQQLLAPWEKKWKSVLGAAPPPPVKTPKTVTTPVTTVSTPKPSGPSAPPVKVTTPITTISTPHVSAPAAPSTPTAPSTGSTSPTRSVSSASSSSSKDGESLLTSSTQGALVPTDSSTKGIPKIVAPQKIDTTQTTTNVSDPSKLQPYTLVLHGESNLGTVRFGGGQIVISGIHVNAAIANDGTATTPPYEASVSVASATIAGVPVTIDADGVHVAGHKQGVPYKQASDSLNAALSQAGIQIFLVKPRVTTYSCGQPATGAATGSTTTTTSTDQSGTASPCGMCPPSGTGTDTGTTSTTTSTDTTLTSTDSSSTTPPPALCDQTGAGAGCGQAGTDTGSSTTTSTTTTTSTDQSSSTSTPIWCTPTSSPSSSSCPTATAPATTTTGTTSDATAAPAMPTSDEETVLATGVHVVFTQPAAASPSGVPAQSVEHIFGEVFVDSLATLAPPLPNLDLSSGLSSSCLGGSHAHGKTKSGSGASAFGGGGGSSAGGGTAASGLGSGSLSSGSGTLGSGTQLASGSTSGSPGSSFPASVVRALKKPLWLLLAYLVWQAIVIGTGASLWRWRKGDAA